MLDENGEGCELYSSVFCGHAASEKHKSGKNYVVVMLGI